MDPQHPGQPPKPPSPSAPSKEEAKLMTQLLLTLSIPAPRPRPHPLEVHPPDPTSGWSLSSLHPVLSTSHPSPSSRHSRKWPLKRQSGKQKQALIWRDGESQGCLQVWRQKSSRQPRGKCLLVATGAGAAWFSTGRTQRKRKGRLWARGGGAACLEPGSGVGCY